MDERTDGLEWHHEAGYRTLRAHGDAASGAFWCHMHARLSLDDDAYCPCFSVTLLNELQNFQLRVAAATRRRQDSRAIAHVVLASAADVYNLGGDLELFCRLIKAQDRSGLMHYA